MGQESLVYSFVARGAIVLAEFSTELTGNFSSIATQCLGKIPSTNNKFTYTFYHHTYNFLVHDGYAYCIVAKEIVSKQISLVFLDRLRDDFKRRYGGGKADTLVAKSLTKEFGPVMKEQMQYIIDHAEEIDKVSKVKAQVSQVKTEMEANIIKVLDRGQGLDALSNKAESLRDAAQEFKRGGDQIRRKMWYQNMKIKLIVLGILLVLALILWLSICHGFNCSN